MSQKYNNSKVKTSEGTFDSAKEYHRYKQLKEMEAQGLISDLQRQVKFKVIDAQYEYRRKGDSCKKVCIEKSCHYVADFVYIQDGEEVVEDVKGYKKGQAYSLYVIKRKLMLERHHIKIREV